VGRECREKAQEKEKTLIQTFSREGREKASEGRGRASEGGFALVSITALANIS
jgi:hypothetical protein